MWFSARGCHSNTVVVFLYAFHFILSLSEEEKLLSVHVRVCVCVCDRWGLVVPWESDGLGKMTGWHRGQAGRRLNMLGSGERCQSCSQPSRNTQEHLGKGDSGKKQTEAPLQIYIRDLEEVNKRRFYYSVEKHTQLCVAFACIFFFFWGGGILLIN